MFLSSNFFSVIYSQIFLCYFVLADAKGRKGSTLPYQSVQTGNVFVEGLRREVQPLRVMSHYGEEKLKLIMGVETIRV